MAQDARASTLTYRSRGCAAKARDPAPIRTSSRFAFAVARVFWIVARVSDWLVEIQKNIAGYPTWLVVDCVLIVVAGVFMFLGKMFRLVGGIVLIAAIGAAGWYAYQSYFGEAPSDIPPPPAGHAPAAPGP
jgi:hypothetical protein